MVCSSAAEMAGCWVVPMAALTAVLSDATSAVYSVGQSGDLTADSLAGRSADLTVVTRAAHLADLTADSSDCYLVGYLAARLAETLAVR